MLRSEKLLEISDGRLYGENDMVRVGCQDCQGCFACCKNMGETVVLDPLDLYRLICGTGKQAEELLQSELELGAVDGVILPHLRMQGEDFCCSFLDVRGRCSVHKYRPGICRLFPLGRYWQGEDFCYILQVGECKKERRTKRKVKQWIDAGDLKQNRKFLREWHGCLKQLRERMYSGKGGRADGDIREEADKERSQWNMELLRVFYLTPYNTQEDFYKQFEERLEEVWNINS